MDGYTKYHDYPAFVECEAVGDETHERNQEEHLFFLADTHCM